MSWQEFIADLTQSLAWPVAIVVLVLTFRRYIAALLPDLESVEAPGFKARFRKKLDKVEDEAHQISGPSGDGSGRLAEEQLIRRVAEVSPRAQILEAWLELEAALYSAADDFDTASGMVRNELVRRDPVRETRTLVDAGWLEPGDLDLVADLRGLRNSVVHERRVALSVDDAVKFSLAARAVAEKLNQEHITPPPP